MDVRRGNLDLFKVLLTDAEIELGLEDCAFILDEYNIKIVNYQLGYLAYFGMKVGLGEYGSSKFSALRGLLKRHDVKFDDAVSLRTSMDLNFKQ